MQTVTFETAKLLKDAGFPQPSEIDPANRWLLFFVEPSEEGEAPEIYSADRIEDIRSFSDPCEVIAFAPSATDLMPPNWMLVRRVSEWECVSEYELDNFFSNNITPEHYFHHESPAEAAAMAWLHVNKKSEA